jgi:hypothetical protein
MNFQPSDLSPEPLGRKCFWYSPKETTRQGSGKNAQESFQALEKIEALLR